MKIAIWIENNWAFGRIAQAFKKYGNVDIYDWRDGFESDRLLGSGEKWRDYDKIISTSVIFNYREFPEEFYQKLVCSVHTSEFDHTFFTEQFVIKPGTIYWGVSKEICEKMKGVNVHWTPFGADTDVFPVKYIIKNKIKTLGIVAAHIGPEHPYYKVKGLALFKEICEKGGFEAVYIREKTPENMFDGIDLLMCCSTSEGGPLGIFEAAASGLPVLTTKVGNAQEISGIATFTTSQEAIEQINSWNANLRKLMICTERVTREVRTNWNMEVLVKRSLESLCPPKFTGSTFLESHWMWPDYIPIPDGPINYLEVGVHSGCNIISFEKSYGHHQDTKIYCIDPWENNEDYDEYRGQQDENFINFKNNIKNFGIEKKVIPIRGYSAIEIPKFQDDFFDIIYIDGNHKPEFVLEDGVLSFRKLKVGGYLVFDDYNFEGKEDGSWTPGPNGTTRGIEAFIKGYGDRIENLGIKWHWHLGQAFLKKI